MLSTENLSEFFKAFTPIFAIGATIWGSTKAFQAQKKFDRESELLGELRNECATYLQLTISLAYKAKNLKSRTEQDKLFASESYYRVRSSYQFIMMFCTDPAFIHAVKRLSELDDVRSGLVRDAIKNNDAPIETSKLWPRYEEAEREFDIGRENFYERIREITMKQTQQRMRKEFRQRK